MPDRQRTELRGADPEASTAPIQFPYVGDDTLRPAIYTDPPRELQRDLKNHAAKVPADRARAVREMRMIHELEAEIGIEQVAPMEAWHAAIWDGRDQAREDAA